MSEQILEYDLYLDESGRFQEGSANPAEQPLPKGQKNVLSQLVGLLVPRDAGDEAAKEIVRRANTQARLPPDNVIHATDIIKKSYPAYLKVVDAIVRGVQRYPEWQFVRLVNVEKMSYGDRATTYPNLVAELTLRTFQQQLKENPGARICIRLIDPKYKLNKRMPPLRADEYRKRITEYLGFAEVRYGLTREKRNWRFDGVVEREYRDAPAIQICDVTSHASADRFDRIRTHKDLVKILKGRFGEYDFTLTIRELFERVDELIKEHSFGMALMILAESLVHVPHATSQDREFSAKLEERLNHIVERMGKTDFRGRDPQLALLVGWLDQLVGQQRLLDKGHEIALWLLTHIDAPLRRLLAARKDESTLDWFAYSLHRWALTACNHKGTLLEGQTHLEAMRSLQPSVARQWERVPLVMDGLIAQSVHYTDCFEFDKASERMRFIADSLKTQSNRFHELMPEDFPEQLKFDLRARALGTFVQSEIFAGTTDPARLQLGRQASEEAVAEFTSFSDRARQYQYRCHLETVAKDFETARKYLVKSMEGTDVEPADYSHNRIVELIRDFSIDPEWKAEFTLLHWLRIGAHSCLDAHEAKDRESTVDVFAERDQFFDALDDSGQLDSDACQGRLSDYPAHSILRFVAVINAARGNWDESTRALQRLHALDPIAKRQFVLAMILLAAQTEVATLRWTENRTSALALLSDGNSGLPNVRQMIQQIQQHGESRSACVSELTRGWSNILAAPEASSDNLGLGLLTWARRNAY